MGRYADQMTDYRPSIPVHHYSGDRVEDGVDSGCPGAYGLVLEGIIEQEVRGYIRRVVAEAYDGLAQTNGPAPLEDRKTSLVAVGRSNKDHLE